MPFPMDKFEGGVTATGATAGTVVLPNGQIIQSALGLGVSQTSGGGLTFEFDAVAEVAFCAIYTPPFALVSSGIVFKCKLHLTDIGDDASLDFDAGLVNSVGANALGSLDHSDVTNKATFHMDGSSANILCQSEDAGTPVTPVDSTLDNSLTVDKELKIVVRADGSCEFYIDNSRVNSSTSFSMATTAVCAGIILLEKTSNDTTGKVLISEFEVDGV